MDYLRVEPGCGSGYDSSEGLGEEQSIVSITLDGKVTSNLVTDLEVASWYTARVRGRNDLGYGPWCESSWKVQIVPTSQPPQVLESYTATDSEGKEQVCISW